MSELVSAAIDIPLSVPARTTHLGDVLVATVSIAGEVAILLLFASGLLLE